MKYSIIAILFFSACSPKQDKPDCWELGSIEKLISQYSQNSTVFVENDTLNILIYDSEIFNKGRAEVIIDNLIYQSYFLNSDKSICFNNFFVGISSIKSHLWIRKANKQYLYTLTFRNTYYPELYEVNDYILKSLDNDNLGQLDKFLDQINEIGNWQKKPSDFCQLAFFYIGDRIKTSNTKFEYEKILEELLVVTKENHSVKNSSSVEYILDFGRSIKGRHEEEDGLPWPKWDDRFDYIKELQNLNNSIKELNENIIKSE